MPIARNSKHSGNRSIHPVSVQARRAGSSEKAQLSSNFGRMQTAKVKAKDMASSAKEKVKEGSAKMQGKTGEATAATHGEKEMAKESARAKKDQANAEKHQEKAEHRADATTGRHGTGVPLTGAHGHHGATGTATYPAASDKYL